MSKAIHTPGPWNLIRYDKEHGMVIRDSQGSIIAIPSRDIHPKSISELLANARLLAAAPDLLAALEKATAELEEAAQEMKQQHYYNTLSNPRAVAIHHIGVHCRNVINKVQDPKNF